MFRVFRPLAWVAIALIVGACAVTRPPFPPDYSVEMQPSDFGEFVVDVYDSAELVVSARLAPEPARNGGASGRVVARPDSNELDISWLGGACDERPFINVKGGPTNLDIELVPNPADIGLVVVGQGCPAVGIRFAVTLTLAERVTEVELRVLDGS